MAFDPFGDFETRGYLRNHKAAKDPEIIKRMEHAAFSRNYADAAENLRQQPELTPQSVRDTHKTLFGGVYPWAGQDRTKTSANQTIFKGSVQFAFPRAIEPLLHHALTLGDIPQKMRDNVGSVMGALADAHPFLDGNGRTIMTVHSEMTRRAGFHIDWQSTNKTDYLSALTDEIAAPERGYLDNYLKPYICEGALDINQMRGQLISLSQFSKPDSKAQLSVAEFADKGGARLREVNLTFPFNEDNAAIHRGVIERVAFETGHDVDFSVITNGRNFEASRRALSDPKSNDFRDIVYDASDPSCRQALSEAIRVLRTQGEDPKDYIIRTAKVGEMLEGSVLPIDEKVSAIVMDKELLVVDNADLPTDRIETIKIEVKSHLSDSYDNLK